MRLGDTACSTACGWCGRCTPKYGPSVNDTGGRAEDLPEPIPDLAARIEAAKAERKRKQLEKEMQHALVR